MDSEQGNRGLLIFNKILPNQLTGRRLKIRELAVPLLMAFILIIGFLLRLIDMTTASLWHDEAHSWFIATASWDLFLESLRGIGVHPPLYFLALRNTINLAGESEGALRLISVLADLITLVLILKLGRLFGGKTGMLVAGAFWAFHPMTIWFAQDARPYSLVAMLSALLILLFVRQRVEMRSWRWAAVSVVSAVGLLTHYFFFLVVGSLILMALSVIRKHPGFFRAWTLFSLIAFLPLAAWLLWFFSQATPSLGIGWITQPTLGDPLLTSWNLLSGYAGLLSVSTTGLGLVALIFAAAGVFDRNEIMPGWKILVIGIFWPLVGVWLLSQRRPIYQDRYFIVLLPFLAILLAMGSRRVVREISQRAPKFSKGPVTAVLSALILLMVLWAGTSVHTQIAYAREDWTGLTDQLRDASSATRIWLMDSEVVVPLRYYYDSEVRFLTDNQPESCQDSCYWVLRQPYTHTHAFTQSIRDPARSWRPEIPSGCQVMDRWDSPTGIGLWQVHCLSLH